MTLKERIEAAIASFAADYVDSDTVRDVLCDCAAEIERLTTQAENDADHARSLMAEPDALKARVAELEEWPCEGDCGRTLKDIDDNHHDKGDGSAPWFCAACWNAAGEALRAERDEWKAKAEAAEQRASVMEAACQGAEAALDRTAQQRDAARADCAALREALVRLGTDLMGTPMTEAVHAAHDAARGVINRPNPGAGYRSPEAARDLAMHVAEAVREDLATHANDFILDAEGGEARAVGDVLRGHDLAAAIAKAEGR